MSNEAIEAGGGTEAQPGGNGGDASVAAADARAVEKPDAVVAAIRSMEESVQKLIKVSLALHRVGKQPGVKSISGWVSVYPIEHVSLWVRLDDDLKADEAKRVIKRLMAVAQVRKATKEFRANDGAVEFTIDGAATSGLVMTVVSGAARVCEVERVETEVEVPAVPAHTEKKVTFRLKDPNCMGRPEESNG